MENKTHFKEMTMIEHLEEFRSMLIKVLVILFVGFALVYSYSDQLSNILLAPLKSAIGTKGQIVYLSVFDKVIVQLQLSFWSSIIITSPLWFIQLWNFIKPGLYFHEIKVIRPFMLTGFLLFCLGVTFAYKVVFPFTLDVLVHFGTQDIAASISFKDYILLCIKALVLFGILFQIPNVMVILGFLEIVTKQSLSSIRRYVYVVFTIVAGLVTPPDVISQVMLLLPLIVLYEVGILAVAFIVHPYLYKKYANSN
jgi:sec-independent protein translocase protein TatC